MSNINAEESHHHLSHLHQQQQQSQQPPQPQTEEVQQTQQQLEDELRHVRESESRLKQQYAEAQRREKLLVRRLAAKEQEMQDYASQNAELKAAQAPTLSTLRSVLLDPAVNILFQKLKGELQSTKARLEDTQNELSAWKFTPDSNTGKRLMAKCRLLYQENEELGKMTSNGRLAKLEGDLALQKSFSEEVKKSQSELDDFLQELDEDVEGMQSTILFLQQELKLAKDTITTLERENSMLKNGAAYDNVALKKQYKDGGGGGGNSVDTTLTDSSSGNYLINGSRLSTASPAESAAHSIRSDPLDNHAGSSATPMLDGNNTTTNLNSYSAASNCERLSKTSLNNNCTAKNSSTSSAASHIVLVETRTLRSSGRNINSVVDELRTSKLKAQYNNGNNCDSAVDANSGIVVSEPMNFNETRKNGSGMSFGTCNSSGSTKSSLRKPPNKRSYYDEDTSSGDDDDDDDDNNSHSNSNLNNNNNSNKNNCKDNNGSSSGGGTAKVVGGNASDCLSSVVAMKKTRRSSVLSLDLNEEDSRIELKADERPLNLAVTSTSGATSASQSDALTSPQNGII